MAEEILLRLEVDSEKLPEAYRLAIPNRPQALLAFVMQRSRDVVVGGKIVSAFTQAPLDAERTPGNGPDTSCRRADN